MQINAVLKYAYKVVDDMNIVFYYHAYSMATGTDIELIFCSDWIRVYQKSVKNQFIYLY